MEATRLEEATLRFGIFYEHQMPRPWAEGGEHRLLKDALEQVELADRLGINYVWEVEHHFLEEYSHSSAPEVFLAAASQRTKRIRLGHGIVQLPVEFNHPARVAERIATLDLVSDGRVEFGTGESSSQAELGGFGVDRDRKREEWSEALDAITRMFVETPFAGYDGRFLSMPPRNVIPKPQQKPHPPLWVACSRRETILMAATKGLGALSFSFVEPEEAKAWVDDYYRILQSDDCVAAGFAVNPNVAVVVPLMCHQDEATAIQRGIDGAHFFGYSLAHYYVFGNHEPGATDVWREFQENRETRGFSRDIVNPDDAPLGVKLLAQGLGSMRGAVGTPKQVSELLSRYEAAGVDQVIFVSQAGPNRHEHICESLELFAKEVMPPFAEAADRVDAEKEERLAEACARALSRRRPPRLAEPGYTVRPDGEPRPARSHRFGAGHPQAAAVNGDSNAGGARGVAVLKDMIRTLASTENRAAIRARLEGGGEKAFGRLLRGKNDEQLETILVTGRGLALIMRGMARSFRPERSGCFSGDIQYSLTAGARGDQDWILRVADGRARTLKGRSGSAAVTLRMSVSNFGRLVAGEMNPGAALVEEKLVIEGDYNVAARLGEMFARRGGGGGPY